MKRKKIIALILALSLVIVIIACKDNVGNHTKTYTETDYDENILDMNKLPKELDALENDKFGDDALPSDLSDSLPPSMPETAANEFSYKYDASIKGVVITKYMGSSLRVRIPEMIENEPVVAIGSEAFLDSGIKEAYIPDSVTEIGDYAFANCEGLTNINIPDGVIKIGEMAFSRCIGLTSIIIPDRIKRMRGNEFENCDNINIIRLGVKSAQHPLLSTEDVILFGDIFWWILDVQDEKALIISETILEHQPFYITEKNRRNVPDNITWEHSTIRKYLNDEFYNGIFTSEEKEQIEETTIINNYYSFVGLYGGNDTTDRIFLLSVDEAERYFVNDLARKSWTYNQKEFPFWLLRSPGVKMSVAAVGGQGHIDVSGALVTIPVGIRPALWLNLQSISD